MWGNLEKELENESGKLITRFERYAARLYEDNERRARRSSVSQSQLKPIRPDYWRKAPGFDPYLVRSRANSIAHSVGRKLRSHDYDPFPPTTYAVPKDDGTKVRHVSVFQIADATVSLMLYRGLLVKNVPKLSQRAYAYRADRTGFDAIMHLQDEFRGKQRLYVAEYDFSQFFDNINHDYIRRTLKDGGYLMTGLEQVLIEKFLTCRQSAGSTERRDIGLAQGTSVSLFLANVAATPIDRQLEDIGVGFARYADDTILFDTNYGKISAAVEALHNLSVVMGVDINQKKSKGIRLLTREPDAAAEFESTSFVDYLGHRISPKAIAFKSAVLGEVKTHVSGLIYDNLLREPIRGTQNPLRLTTTDRDYATLVWQLRRYFYGNLSEREVRRFARGSVPMRRFIGLMSFFPLLDDHAQLEEFDNWVTDQIWLAMRKRHRILGRAATGSAPNGLARSELRKFQTTSGSTGKSVDLRLPSLALMAQVVNQASRTYGPAVVARNGALQYIYD